MAEKKKREKSKRCNRRLENMFNRLRRRKLDHKMWMRTYNEQE